MKTVELKYISENLIDTFFALMAIPTMIATLILAPKVLNELKKYEIKR